jgi:hypothetical protein
LIAKGKELDMSRIQEAALAERALSNVDQLLTNYNLGDQIESALPLLHRHRCMLVQLRNALYSTCGGKAAENADERWVDDLVTTYRQLGSQAPHMLVYRKMKELRVTEGRSWPEHAEEAIRQTIQAYCAESPQYRGGPDLFRMVRPGLWRLKTA